MSSLYVSTDHNVITICMQYAGKGRICVWEFLFEYTFQNTSSIVVNAKIDKIMHTDHNIITICMQVHCRGRTCVLVHTHSVIWLQPY